MASSNLESSEEKTNGWKLMRLIVDGGTEALRKIFLNIYPGNLHHVLATHRSTLYPLYNQRRIITQPQWDKLYPHPPRIPNIQEFDITLLVVLLRNICGLSAPITGWDTTPSSTDKSREANIVRIKLFRNNFFGHVPGTDVGRLDFEARWVEVSSTLLGLGISKVEIDSLKAEECGEEEVNRVREKWSQSDREIVSKLDGFEKMLEEVYTLSHDLSKQAKSQSDDILLQILHSCDFENEIQLLRKRYTEGTREWVFDQVSTWLDNKSSTNRAFIIVGQAGMGKSVIAAVVCKLFPEHFAACHFFQYNNSRYNNSKFLLQSLALQLSKVFPGYKEELSAKLSGCKGQIINDMNIEGLFSLLFKEPFARCISDQSTTFLIVIDALDETRQEDRYELVDLITKYFHQLPSYIRFLITTRSEKDIMRKFEKLNPIFLEPDEERNLNDLRVFFEAECVLKGERVEMLIRKCEGLMLYASFMAKRSEADLDNESLPKGVEEIYESHFKRLENELKILSIGEGKFFSLLSVLAVAKQPLPLLFIEKLLCPGKDSSSARRMLLKLINCVSSLFVVKDECISIFHKSVGDWLVKPGHFFSIFETDGHKTLAYICVNQLQMLKQCEVRFTCDPAIKYALQYGIPHILGAEIKDEDYLATLINGVIDLEIIHSSLCIDVDTTLTNLVNLLRLNMYNSIFERTQARIKMLIRIIRKFIRILQVTPQSFLQHVLNEKIGELSTEASGLLMTRYKELAYFEFDEVQGTTLVGRILTERNVVEVDLSPSEDFVVVWYGDEEIELFSLSDFKPRWKIDNIVQVCGRLSDTLRHIAFHPFLNIIFPGQLDPVINLEGKYVSGPITFENVPAKFTRCCFSHDHSKMVTEHDDNLIVWNLRDNKKVVTLEYLSPLDSFSFSGNDRYIATTGFCFFNVYDTENSYSLTSKRCYESRNTILLSTFKLDSWYCISERSLNDKIVKCDLTDQPFYMDFMFLPRNKRAACEFQAIMENRTPMWFQKLGLYGHFFILGNRNNLSTKYKDYELRISKISELKKGSKLKQEYDKLLTVASFHCGKSTVMSVNGKYIYTSGPCISSIEPGKSWKLVGIKHTPLLPVTNGVFAMKVKKEFDEGTPELWNADLTKILFKFPELTGTLHFLSVTENLVACIMTSEVRFFDVAKKEIVARTQLPHNLRSFDRFQHIHNVITCSSQYHVVYTTHTHVALQNSAVDNTLLLQKTKFDDLSEVLKNLNSTGIYIVQASFSPGGGLLAFSCENTFSIHILDISTFQILCVLHNIKAEKLEFFDEEHLLCKADFGQSLFLVNVKNGDILAGISVDVNRNWNFSVCRKTGDIVVFDIQCNTLRLFKLWLSHQRKDKNELRECCCLT